MNEHELKDYLTGLYGKVKPGANGWIRIQCPTCTVRDSKKMKRYVHMERLTSKCFICEQYLSRQQLMGTENIPNIVLENKLQSTVDKPEHPWARKMPGYKFIPLHELKNDHPAVKFFLKDHLLDLKGYYASNGIVYCPADGGHKFCDVPLITSADRLIFPVTLNKELVGWQMRSVPGTVFGDLPNVVKYYHLFNKGDYLYNYDNAKQYTNVVLTEGVKKALKFPNGVASLGKGLTSVQIQLIQNWKEVIIFLDGEDSTQQLASTLAKAIRANGRKAIAIDPRKYGFPSPDEAPSDELIFIVANEWAEAYGNN